MPENTHVLRIGGATAKRAVQTTLARESFSETRHLERWVIDNPEVLGGDVLIVCTQYADWSSIAGKTATQRLDVLGLDVSGQRVVVELKLGHDKGVHLQALTYAALGSSFTEDSLALAHQRSLNSDLSPDRGEGVWSVEDAKKRLLGHIDEGWQAELVRRPRSFLSLKVLWAKRIQLSTGFQKLLQTSKLSCIR